MILSLFIAQMLERQNFTWLTKA